MVYSFECSGAGKRFCMVGQIKNVEASRRPAHDINNMRGAQGSLKFTIFLRYVFKEKGLCLGIGGGGGEGDNSFLGGLYG